MDHVFLYPRGWGSQFMIMPSLLWIGHMVEWSHRQCGKKASSDSIMFMYVKNEVCHLNFLTLFDTQVAMRTIGGNWRVWIISHITIYLDFWPELGLSFRFIGVLWQRLETWTAPQKYAYSKSALTILCIRKMQRQEWCGRRVWHIAVYFNALRTSSPA